LRGSQIWRAVLLFFKVSFRNSTLTMEKWRRQLKEISNDGSSLNSPRMKKQ